MGKEVRKVPADIAKKAVFIEITVVKRNREITVSLVIRIAVKVKIKRNKLTSLGRRQTKKLLTFIHLEGPNSITNG